MASCHVVKCRNLLFIVDINRVCNFACSLTSDKFNKINRIRQCRHFGTSRNNVTWTFNTPDDTVKPQKEHVLAQPLLRAETDIIHEDVIVEYYRGLPQITVPLPSRREKCRFTLRPISNTVGDFLNMLRSEDHGIDHVSVTTSAGVRIASSNTIEALMEDDFRLVINDVCYFVKTPKQERLSKEEVERLSDVKNLVNQLYEALSVEEHQLKKERDLCGELEKIKVELEPMEQKRLELNTVAERHTNTLTWVGLGLMSVQFGILARLTWWEYSWDIMEPVTYFVTYGTAMAAYAYYVLTKQEYVLPDVKDRQYLITLHKRAKKIGLDLDRYNYLKDSVYRIENDLRRLRDPLQIHLPPHHLADSSKKSSNPFIKAFNMLNIKRSTNGLNKHMSSSASSNESDSSSSKSSPSSL